VPEARKSRDYERAGMSILEMRDNTKRARNVVRPDSRAQEALSSIIRSCNRYLEESESDPDRYQYLLERLRTELTKEVELVTSSRRGLYALEPGEAAY
jgi:DNA repair ATPase RecN